MSLRVEQIKPNMTVVSTCDRTFLVSYKTPVACRIDGVWYRTSEFHSRTTSKHLNKFLDGMGSLPRNQEWINEQWESLVQPPANETVDMLRALVKEFQAKLKALEAKQ